MEQHGIRKNVLAEISSFGPFVKMLVYTSKCTYMYYWCFATKQTQYIQFVISVTKLNRVIRNAPVYIVI